MLLVFLCGGSYYFSALKELLLEKQNLLTKTTQELSELGSYKVCIHENMYVILKLNKAN